MHSSKRSNLVLCGLAFIGFILLNDSFVTRVALEHLIAFFLGSMLFLIPFSILYLRAANSHSADCISDISYKNHLRHTKPVLKILDWVLLCFVVSLMPCFETLGLDPHIWMEIILIPAVIFRIVVSWYVKSWQEK